MHFCCNYNLLQGVILTIPAHFPCQDEKWGNKIAQPTRIFNSLKISWNSALKIKRLEREWVGNIRYDIPYQVEEHSWCSILKGPRTTEANGGIFTERRRKTPKTGTEVKTLSWGFAFLSIGCNLPLYYTDFLSNLALGATPRKVIGKHTKRRHTFQSLNE